MRILHATHCLLEPQVEAHAREMFDVLSDPAIYEFENEPPPSLEYLANRYSLLETRTSADGTEIWLNWVARVPSGELVGYVQATVLQSGSAFIAYELASRYWRRGIAHSAVRAVIAELELMYRVRLVVAVLKSKNFRSFGLLRKLGFETASPLQFIEYGAESDELVMVSPSKPNVS